MKREIQLVPDIEERVDQVTIGEIGKAIHALSACSEEEFVKIKDESWFTRVFDLVTFSQKGKMRVAEQISELAQAQQILIELILRLSNRCTDIDNVIWNHSDAITKLIGNDVQLANEVRSMKLRAVKYNNDGCYTKLYNDDLIALISFLQKIVHIQIKNEIKASIEQKKYGQAIRHICGNIGICSNLDNLADECDNQAKKTIYLCCLEYLYLNKHSWEDLSKYDSALELLDIGPKTKKSIQEQIEIAYEFTGVDGLCAKFESQYDSQISDSFEIDVDDCSDEGGKDIRIEEFIDSNKCYDIGTTQMFENKILHIDANIEVHGKLVISDCDIYYRYNNGAKDGHIKISSGGYLTIEHCRVICEDSNLNYFIQCDDNVTVTITRTVFIDCAQFLRVNKQSVVTFDKCKFYNCVNFFLGNARLIDEKCYARSKKKATMTQVKNSEIYIDNIQKFHQTSENGEIQVKSNKKYFHFSAIFKPHNTGMKFINNNIVQRTKKYDLVDLISTTSNNDRTIVENCTFMGYSGTVSCGMIRNCIFVESSPLLDRKSTAYCGQIVKSAFEKCISPINADCNTVADCLFYKCYGKIVHIVDCFSGNHIVSGCSFLRCGNAVNRINFKTSIISLEGKGERQAPSIEVSNCQFDCIDCGERWLLEVSTKGKPQKRMLSVNNCTIKNIVLRNDNTPFREAIQSDSLLLLPARGTISNITVRKGKRVPKPSIPMDENGRPIGANWIHLQLEFGDNGIFDSTQQEYEEYTAEVLRSSELLTIQTSYISTLSS